MAAADRYLAIPSGYCRWLGRLRWSYTGEVIEYDDGGTFAFGAEIAAFLEGFGAERPLVSFGFILHLLHLLSYGRVLPPAGARELHEAFRDTGRRLRNAGVLLARLCGELPPAPEQPDPAEVCRRLASGSLTPVLFIGPLLEEPDAGGDLPPLTPQAFEQRIVRALGRLRADEIRHWLVHGQGPVGEVGEELARQALAARPRTLAGILAELVQAPRLAGAVPHVAQFDSALALPPRRLAEHELPSGGYADVSTHGQPERLLPSQFAIEDLEFVRRFAERELLYFRREEPEARTREPLVLLLDQGVRTWGVVRLVLAAAALALCKRAVRMKLPLGLAATSSGGRVLDPLREDDRAVRDLVEASDLSPNPGLALERVLEEDAQVGRDIVLLTHPRSLAEADVGAAARRALGGTRLFAVAADARGAVEFCELRRGVPVRLAQLRVDLTKRQPAPPRVEPAAARMGVIPPWQGDVEPVGFPFRFGLDRRLGVHHLEFDGAGESLLSSGASGYLHLSKLDGSHVEMLPRAMVDGMVLKQVQGILGVAGGFVVCGRIDPRAVLVHYDLSARRCTAYSLAPMSGHASWAWSYSRGCHIVVAWQGPHWIAVDLSMREPVALTGDTGDQERDDRVAQAIMEGQAYSVPPPFVRTTESDTGNGGRDRSSLLVLDSTSGRLTLTGVQPAWIPFVAQADGWPALKDHQIVRACYREGILAALFWKKGRGEYLLRVFAGPSGIPLGEFPCRKDQHAGFALSPDGRFLACTNCGPEGVKVYDLRKAATPIYVTPCQRFHDRLVVHLGEEWLSIQIGQVMHLLHWQQDHLVCKHSRSNRLTFMEKELSSGRIIVVKGSVVRKHWLCENAAYDPQRFVAGVFEDVHIAVDIFGHVVVWNCAGKLICMFHVFRERLAGWMPDGTHFDGPRAASPNAYERFGAALREACELGRANRT
jgi:hypothetical protein